MGSFVISDRVRAGEGLLWLARLLWGESERVQATIAGPGSRPALERYLVVPNAARARFLVPLESKQAAAASLRNYNALRRPRVRLARWALGTGLGTGLVQSVLRDRVEVRATNGALDAGQELLREHLAQVLGVPGLVAAIGIGNQGPTRKPVLQLFSRRGHPIGFAKVGWNAVTRELVRNEAEVLELLAEAPRRSLDVPRLIHQGTWRDLDLCVTSPLPPGVRRHRPFDRPPPLSMIREVAALHGVQTSSLGESAYWKDVRGRAEESLPSLPPAAADALGRWLDLIDRYRDQTLEFGTWHGDWSPWNMVWLGSRLYVLDWEQCRADVPLGLDLLHFEFQVAFIWRRQSVRRSLERVRQVLPRLSQVGVARPARRAIASLHVLELFLRANEALRAGGEVHRRFYPAILSAFESIGAEGR